MYIYWIDPGARKLWFAVITKDLNIIDAGILLSEIKSPSRNDYFTRLAEIQQFFAELFVKYPPSIVSMEKLYFTSHNQSNAEFVFGVRALILCEALNHHSQIQEYTPIELKSFITWNGKATKELVQLYTQKLFWLSETAQYNDAADALGLAFIAAKGA